ncbi:AAA family ATPase [Acinetobacter sp. V102_4]|uniref:AAA family ATPase n=1 Tax=Acinetobacter sp. V102_4 TaxID=3072984 RepID=UPI00287C1B31|nr:AAA family ATPase [Acinetobacter sp. V102_4]MDS7930969.1 AAA family ATPase [Acinetobacter sp. V102_4]
MKFEKITLTEWRQFSKIEIEFHPNVTIITGANGAGKSTILKLLSKHFGWHHPFLGTPFFSKEQGVVQYKSIFTPLTKNNEGYNYYGDSLGKIIYSNNAVADICINQQIQSEVQFNLNITDQLQINGVHINSHRPVPRYERLQNIPTNPMDASQAFDSYLRETFNLFNNSYTQHSPTYRMKEAIVSMAAFGPGNQFVQKNEKIEKQFYAFKEILKHILPIELGFKDLSIRMPDIVLETDSGDFLLDASSGGIMSIIDLAWQIFLYSHDKEEFVVTIDEPENHLHPSMQRSLLNDFVKAFPRAQFIVVTHSPFIVSSIRDSNVYALKYENFKDDDVNKVIKKVVSQKLDLDQKAATANEILRDVLGVPVTLPKWADEDLQKICSMFTVEDITVDGLRRLRNELNQAGLGEFYPEALNNIVEGQKL